MTQKLAPHSHQMFKSINVKQVTEYVKLKYTYLQGRNALNRAEQLNLPGSRAAFAERLDSDVLKASCDAERNIKQFQEPAWSQALSKARLSKIILKKWLTMHRTGLDHSHLIMRDLESFDIEMSLPTSKQQRNLMIRDTQAEIDKIVAESYKDATRREMHESTRNSINRRGKPIKIMLCCFVV